MLKRWLIYPSSFVPYLIFMSPPSTETVIKMREATKLGISGSIFKPQNSTSSPSSTGKKTVFAPPKMGTRFDQSEPQVKMGRAVSLPWLAVGNLSTSKKIPSRQKFHCYFKVLSAPLLLPDPDLVDSVFKVIFIDLNVILAFQLLHFVVGFCTNFAAFHTQAERMIMRK